MENIHEQHNQHQQYAHKKVRAQDNENSKNRTCDSNTVYSISNRSPPLFSVLHSLF
jgi:hypothetical protein